MVERTKNILTNDLLWRFKMSELSKAGHKANIEYFQNLRRKLAEQAMSKWSKEAKWNIKLQMHEDPEVTLRKLLIS